MAEHSELVKKHFDIKYKDYDKLIRNLIPNYEAMHKKVVSLINFPKDKKIDILDLGIGTGKTALDLLKKFPNVHIEGIDISKNMIEQGKIRLKGYSNKINFEFLNMINFISKPLKFDVCVSVLSIHHLNLKEKQKLFSKIFDSLKEKGIFVIGDIINFDTKKETEEKEQEWKSFLIKNLGKNEGDFWFRNYQEEDLPDSINNQLKWLKNAGFRKIDCIWQFMNYAVFYGRK